MRKLLQPLFLGALLVTTFSACGGGQSNGDNQTDLPPAPPLPAPVTIMSPSADTTLPLGDIIHVRWESPEPNIDSCVLYLGAKRVGGNTATESVQIPTEGHLVGVHPIRVESWKEGRQRAATRKVTILAKEPPKRYGYRVVASYPHDPDAYTQGLLFHSGKLYESTGQRGQSTLREVELTTGKVTRKYHLEAQFFGEGLALHSDRFYQLTWTAGRCFIYSPESLKPLEELRYSGQGWGLESDGVRLWMSDGSENIYVRNPEGFQVEKTLQVYNHEGAQTMLNELEFIDGLLYANIYMRDIIVAIDTATGAVVREIDLSGLLKGKDKTREAEVLNGIAYDKEKRAIYVTGKYWPRLFHVEFVPR